mmetsp:Transcript_26691/g.84946  ORF Transcript_26691/g.84946 Transcript_26691/m.84946 type:complete len:208 (-) Transcript_26691:101-724(-)
MATSPTLALWLSLRRSVTFACRKWPSCRTRTPEDLQVRAATWRSCSLALTAQTSSPWTTTRAQPRSGSSGASSWWTQRTKSSRCLTELLASLQAPRERCLPSSNLTARLCCARSCLLALIWPSRVPGPSRQLRPLERCLSATVFGSHNLFPTGGSRAPQCHVRRKARPVVHRGGCFRGRLNGCLGGRIRRPSSGQWSATTTLHDRRN